MNANNDKANDKHADRRALSSGARLYAVQALYQMEAAGQSADRVMREFELYRLGVEDEDGQYLPADDGERGSARTALQNPCSDCCFERCHGAGHRRLRGAQRDRGVRERPFVDHGDERAQLPYLHGHTESVWRYDGCISRCASGG